MPKILITGGAGYIGSQTAYFLRKRGYETVIVDNLSRGYRHNVPQGMLREASLEDTGAITKILQAERPDAVIHFAAYIAVGESTREPALYFTNNVSGSLSLFSAMNATGVRKLVFSSTAAVYGNPETSPIPETARLAPVNPYGESKLMIETALGWLDKCAGFRNVALRYFNACGTDPESGLGEEHEPETHLIPLILKAIQTGKPLTIFGDDYTTPDGTCIRDYIHVSDLASAHALAVESLLEGGPSAAYNCGTGVGFSVKQVLAAAARATGKEAPYHVGPRRKGDPASLVADSSKLQKALGWKPAYSSLDDILKTAWAFQHSRAAK
jgi:UDP-glucose 4-epimerase